MKATSLNIVGFLFATRSSRVALSMSSRIALYIRARYVTARRSDVESECRFHNRTQVLVPSQVYWLGGHDTHWVRLHLRCTSTFYDRKVQKTDIFSNNAVEFEGIMSLSVSLASTGTPTYRLPITH